MICHAQNKIVVTALHPGIAVRGTETAGISLIKPVDKQRRGVVFSPFFEQAAYLLQIIFIRHPCALPVIQAFRAAF